MKIPFKENLPLLIAGLVVLGLSIWFLMDYVFEIILGIFGLGGVAIAREKRKQDQLQAKADAHMDMMDVGMDEALQDQMEADLKAADAKQKIDNIKDPENEVKPGRKRTNFPIR